MKFKDMQEGIRYSVTKGSTDGAFVMGDSVFKQDNVILNQHAGGWMEKEAWETDYSDVEVEVDKEVLKLEISIMLKKLAKLDEAAWDK